MNKFVVAGVLALAVGVAQAQEFTLGGKPSPKFVLAGVPQDAFKPQKADAAEVVESPKPLVIKKSVKTYAQGTLDAKKSGKPLVIFIGVPSRAVANYDIVREDSVPGLQGNSIWVAKVSQEGEVEGYMLDGGATDEQIVGKVNALFPAKQFIRTVLSDTRDGTLFNGSISFGVGAGVCIGGNCPRR